MNPIDRHLTLVVSGLLDQAGGSLPALEKTLARADRRTVRAGFEATLFELFGVEADPARDLPVAAVSYVSDAGRMPDGYCLRADPVYLVPDRDHLVLAGSAVLHLTQAEAEQLVVELNAHFAEDGWRWDAPAPTRWYLTLPEAPELRTFPLASVTGKAIRDFLPVGPKGKRWHAIMNEVQMLLHASEVNRQREALGQLPVSSVWFWGGGNVPEVGRSRWSQVWSDAPVSRGLAELSHTSHSRLPADAQAWLREAEPGAHMLVFGESAQAALPVFYETWFAPLIAALRERTLNSLTLHPCNGQGFHLTRAGLRRWWRRWLS